MSAGSRFDRTADAYAAAARRRDWSDLVAWCEPAAGDRVLDVAGGTGALAGRIAPLVAEVTVADVSEPMLAHVPEGVRRVVARAEQLPFEDASFDLVTCVRSLHHIDRPARALDEMARVLAPGGRLVIEDYIADPDRDSSRRWEHIERLRDPAHRRLLAAGEARTSLLAVGLQVDAEESWLVDHRVDPWLGLAGCEGAAARRVRGLIGAPEFQVRLARARFRRPAPGQAADTARAGASPA